MTLLPILKPVMKYNLASPLAGGGGTVPVIPVDPSVITSAEKVRLLFATGTVGYDSVLKINRFTLNGAPTTTQVDTDFGSAAIFNGVDQSFYEAYVTNYIFSDGWLAASFRSSEAVKQTIFGPTRTSIPESHLLLNITASGELEASLQNNTVDIWAMKSIRTVFANGTPYRVMLSGGANGPRLWVNGVAEPVTYSVGNTASSEWLSSLIGVTNGINRFSYATARQNLANVSPFNGVLAAITVGNVAVTSGHALADFLLYDWA